MPMLISSPLFFPFCLGVTPTTNTCILRMWITLAFCHSCLGTIPFNCTRAEISSHQIPTSKSFRLQVAQRCDEHLLELIGLVHKSVPAFSAQSAAPVARMVYPCVRHAVELCESEHDQSLASALERANESEEVLAPLLNKLNGALSEQFFEAYMKRWPGSQLRLRLDDSPEMARALGSCCQLSDLDLLKATQNYQNVAQLEGQPEVGKRAAPSIRAYFQLHLVEACQVYCQLTGDTFERAQWCASFREDKDLGFIARRSSQFRLGLFRFAFCKAMLGSQGEIEQRLEFFDMSA